MKIVLIGTGNVATVLGNRISKGGHEVVQVFGRNESRAKNLAKELGDAAFTSDISKLKPDADIFLIAITDDAIGVLAKEMRVHNKMVVHTAGSVSKDVLKPISRNYGVFYPLQSIRKERREVSAVPILVDGNTSDDLTFIFDFAKTISHQVEIAGDTERSHLHLAAVLVNNFVNHLYWRAYEYCLEKGLSFDLLLPLIRETADRLSGGSPALWQTGPAMRYDNATIQKHLVLLSENPGLADLYIKITADIQAHLKKNQS